MNKLQKIAGYIWASPVTAVGLAYASVFKSLKWYDFIGQVDDALVFRTAQKSPRWLKEIWKNWDGHAIGNVIVMNCDPEAKPRQLAHEMVHVRQCMRLGIFQPLVYAICWVVIKVGCESSHPYWDQPFEIDARRSVGQYIDVVGGLKKIRESAAKKD